MRTRRIRDVKLAANGAAQSLVAIPGNPPRVHDIRDVPHGIVQENWYRSKAAGGQTRHFFVYTPPGYDPRLAAGYPVMALLHGAGNSETNWQSIGRANFILDNLIADKRALPMLLVMPFGHILPPGGDLPRNNALFEQDLLDDIMPAVEARYNTAKGAKNRAIAGFPWAACRRSPWVSATPIASPGSVYSVPSPSPKSRSAMASNWPKRSN